MVKSDFTTRPLEASRVFHFLLLIQCAKIPRVGEKNVYGGAARRKREIEVRAGEEEIVAGGGGCRGAFTNGRSKKI